MDVPSPLQISRSQSRSKSGENVALVSYLRAEPPCTPPKKATGWVKGTPSTNRPPTNPTYHKFLAQSDSITTHIIYPSDSLSQPHSNDFSFYLQDKQAHFSVILDAHGRNRHKYIHIHPDIAQISVRLRIYPLKLYPQESDPLWPLPNSRISFFRPSHWRQVVCLRIWKGD